MNNPDLERFLAEIPKETEIFVDLYADIVERIEDLMEMKGYSQKGLAVELSKRPSEVNKWLKGEHNLTLKTIAKLQAVFGEPIINVPVKKSFISVNKKGFNLKTSFTVIKNTDKTTIDPKNEKEVIPKVKFSA